MPDDLEQPWVLLQCQSPEGRPRYDLPALFVGSRGDYLLYWRPNPALVIHHSKNKRFTLPEPELVFVAPLMNHCISVSVDPLGWPIGAYVNINLPPEQISTGWAWGDLELDWKLQVDHRGRWTPILLDVAEFEAARLGTQWRAIAISEAVRILDSVAGQVFPFNYPLARYLGELSLPVPAQPLYIEKLME